MDWVGGTAIIMMCILTLALLLTMGWAINSRLTYKPDQPQKPNIESSVKVITGLWARLLDEKSKLESNNQDDVDAAEANEDQDDEKVQTDDNDKQPWWQRLMNLILSFVDAKNASLTCLSVLPDGGKLLKEKLESVGKKAMKRAAVKLSLRIAANANLSGNSKALFVAMGEHVVDGCIEYLDYDTVTKALVGPDEFLQHVMDSGLGEQVFNFALARAKEGMESKLTGPRSVVEKALQQIHTWDHLKNLFADPAGTIPQLLASEAEAAVQPDAGTTQEVEQAPRAEDQNSSCNDNVAWWCISIAVILVAPFAVSIAIGFAALVVVAILVGIVIFAVSQQSNVCSQYVIRQILRRPTSQHEGTVTATAAGEIPETGASETEADESDAVDAGGALVKEALERKQVANSLKRADQLRIDCISRIGGIMKDFPNIPELFDSISRAWIFSPGLPCSWRGYAFLVCSSVCAQVCVCSSVCALVCVLYAYWFRCLRATVVCSAIHVLPICVANAGHFGFP